MKRVKSVIGRVRQEGFTLVEMMVALLISMIVLGLLIASFLSQFSEYKYQNSRVEAVQDAEFVVNFIADDLRSALVIAGAPVVNINDVGADPNKYTDFVDITVWDEDNWPSVADRDAADFRAVRRYEFDPVAETLSYDRNIVPAIGMAEILPNVTDFRVFRDVPGAQPVLVAGTPFPGSPPGLQNLTVLKSNASPVASTGFTVLIEVAVEPGYKEGSFINARGVDVSGILPLRKRVWRYVQVHPLSAGD